MNDPNIYYEHDGAYFRRPKNAPGMGVREVLHGDKWVPYEADDMIAPVMYGNRIDASEVPGLAAEGSEKAVQA